MLMRFVHDGVLAQATKSIGALASHHVAEASCAAANFARTGDPHALFGAAVGFHFGHVSSLFLEIATSSVAALQAQHQGDPGGTRTGAHLYHMVGGAQ